MPTQAARDRRSVLGAIHYGLALFLLASSVVRIVAQQFDRAEERAAERRLTSLEGSVARLVDDMQTIRTRGQWDWIQQLCLALLVGERGNAVLRRNNNKRPVSPEANEE